MKPTETMSEINRRYSILYAEDKQETREGYASFLESCFNTVYVAADGEEALELYHKHKPDIMLLDINMPKRDGLEVSKAIREEDLRSRIIILTAHTEQERLLFAAELGLTRYLLKPVKRQDLRNALAKASTELDFMQNGNSKQIALKEGYTWDRDMKRLILEGKEIKLTKREIILLECLTERPGYTFSFEEILYSFWDKGIEKEMTEDGLKALIKRLRQKLPSGTIENIFGVGYRFVS
ncbi:MAG: response regulator transcription factor [Sulfurimonadaceae bacterium]|nr:response regulator transcription factor [Sulfurimonadaceae bacterium]